MGERETLKDGYTLYGKREKRKMKDRKRGRRHEKGEREKDM